MYLFKSLLVSVIIIGLGGDISAQSIWRQSDVSKIEIRSDWSGEFKKDSYQIWKLDINQMKSELRKASLEDYSSRNVYFGKSTIQIPMPDGTISEFAITESPSMEPGISQRYSNIKSYKGINLEDRNEIIRFDLGPYGFHALISTNKGMIQVDPYNRENQEIYVSYYTSDYISDSYSNVPFCGVEHEAIDENRTIKFGSRSGEPMELRVYRLAMACTPSWAAARGTVEKCLADMNTMMNRANLIYEKELAIKMLISDKNDRVIFLDESTSPYTDTEQGRLLINQNTTVLNTRIGSNFYDIGHILSRCFDVGGIASLGSMCTFGKGAGVTCHNNLNIESIVTRVLSHEMGHQMSASHTFNACNGSTQLSLGTGFEPGSGSTIMSYAGGCGPDNLINNNDDYYHVASLNQMLGHTNFPSSDAYLCAEKVDIGNTVPSVSVNLRSNLFIPISTPFELTGQASDLENDPMTYIWEQYNNGGTSPLGSPEGNVPIFRSLRPNVSPTRFFPNANRILTNRFKDVDELLPTYSRLLTFMFVVRDNHPLGSAANWQEVKFNVTADAGPFQLTFPRVDAKFKVGQKVNVTWDVANTDVAPVNCKRVNIYLSVNDELRTGNQNLIPLAINVDNDGSEQIIMPNVISNRVRIVIKAADNIFLTTGVLPSIIEAPTEPSFFMQVNDNVREVCLPNNLDFNFNTEGFGGLADPIKFEVVSGLPEGATASFTQSQVVGGESTILNLNLNDVKGTQNYEILVRAYVDGLDTLERKLYLSLTGTDIDDLVSYGPENGLTGASSLQTFVWSKKEDAVSYEFQLATSPAFNSQNLVLTRVTADTSFTSTLILDKSTIYYWRVRAANHCRDGKWLETKAFNTEAATCFTAESGLLSLNISASGTPVVEGSLVVFGDFEINDLNIKYIKGTHQRVGDLAFFLTSPQDTKLQLWNRRCSTSSNFNVGLDDESVDFFQCPINTGRIYRPDSPLSIFNGENTKGTWKIRIEDLTPGEGGRFNEFSLEFCTNVTLDPPYLENNNLLTITPSESRVILPQSLEAKDNNDPASKLVFTLVSIPQSGTILLGEMPLNIGSTYTQADIDESRIRYVHNGDSATTDNFSFTVTDGQGGWVSITYFNIEIDQSVSTQNINDISNAVTIYPNPTADLLFVNILQKDFEGSLNYSIYSASGQVIRNLPLNYDNSVDVSDMIPGMYLIRIYNEKFTAVKKFFKQ